MADTVNQQIVLKSRPVGEPQESDFALVESPIPQLGEGEVLNRTIYLSLDPYMRGRLSTNASYAASTELNSVIVGETVSQVIQSHHPDFQPGDFVLSNHGWQTYAVAKGKTLRKLDPNQAPLSYYLGVLGMPGLTAYAALLDIGQPKAGETVVISAASGAVGAVAGQIAKIKGARVVGIVGSDQKRDYIVKELGFNVGINRRTQEIASALKEAAPDGIDVYFDNTAGEILEAVLQQINLGARIPLVGLISQYNASSPPPGPNLLPLLIKRALIKGFLVSDYQHRFSDFARDVTEWLQSGQLKYKEDIVVGLENAPRAFIGLLRGENFGKLIVEVSQ
ncbi:Zinc-containing alcohol dehydrogenase superfamily [Trichormus variabilis ATCC 29413]|uniref:Zinc-containing alcohol dehydrogenase superfamily n=2 Tax=Anabaena variabilis TaxID=264691 RepID=Q3M4R1_TRIV2|nr:MULTISPECIES: NADP-dependent oxidoreductase [Nostocaceae]ABA24025.1 Zinc-containing alcohol dehydrogenase superfamily [Trichormus variabilis ATCC 29413]MBC1213229.1 NADP-dependent oxidoreductase [Trichormus variabilis ARAD]MBC1256175.1 NADP-dependent oxidoreductase [Trichormus variabilis V5]MBC1267364.1 NADP-dependent oxidoreductase [Trichormus variabilis FSR]MBC1300700.1 NADP-dependent oxidoreductase [Trichormus variabilis N2B]